MATGYASPLRGRLSAAVPVWRALLSASGGNAAVETALLVPVVLLLLTGVMQGGYILYIYNDMLHVAQEAARSVALGASTPAEAELWAEEHLGTGDREFDVTIDNVGSDIETVVAVPLTDIVLIDPFGLFSTGNLHTAVTAKGL